MDGADILFRRAEQSDFADICNLYDRVIERVSGTDEDPIWDRSIHPSDGDIESAIEGGTLFCLGEPGRGILGAVVLDADCCEGYEQAPWRVDARPDQMRVVHLLAGDPALRGRGLGRALLRGCIGQARSEGCKALRLDVLPNLRTARALYEREGFACLGLFRLHYPDPRVRDFMLYELPLRD